MNSMTPNLKSLLVAAAALTATFSASAVSKWERSLQLTAADAVFVTSKGTVLAADNNFQVPATSGIYYSTDEGENWAQCNVAKWQYNCFFEAGDYVFALGEQARIARSDDDGRTWTVLNYSRYLTDYIEEKEMDYITAYAAAYDPERQRIYIPVWSGNAGVIYSDDFGVTWNMTNRESLQITFQDGEVTFDSFYGASFFKGQPQVWGIYLFYTYDAEKDRWSKGTDASGQPYNSNMLAIVASRDNELYAGRAMENDGMDKPFIQSTTDLKTWKHFKHPGDLESTYVRAITTDDEYVYAATINLGIYRTKDDGETWQAVGTGLPKDQMWEICNADRTIQLAFSEHYLFAAQHDFFNSTSGIYRLSREDMGAELSEVSLKEIADQQVTATVTDNEISAPGAIRVAVCSMTGVELLAADGETLSTASLPAGAYVYSVTASNGAISNGKFIKR